MNKKSIFIALFVAVVSAAFATYVTINLVDVKSSGSKVISVAADIPSHLTANIDDGATPDLVYAAEKTVPVVVGIEKIVTERGGSNQYYGGNIDPFLELFGFGSPYSGGSQRGYQQQQPRESRSGGSGVILSKDGYIVTNNHVVENGDKLTVTLSDGQTYKAKLIGTDPTTDIALVKIDADDLPFATLGSSEALRLGQWVLAVGNPYGLNSTVTAGIVSAKSRNLDVIPSQFRIESFIQTDAAVNPGNSGGALVNTAGELVGINTVIKSPTGSFAGYSFAVPSSIVKKVVVDLMEYGIVQRGLLGIEYNEINEQFIENLSEELGVDDTEGLYVRGTTRGGAAEEVGIEEGDIIVGFNDIKISNSPQLQEQIAKYRPGDKVKISVKRAGKVKHFDIVLRNKSGEAKLLDKNSTDYATFLGGEFANISSKTKQNLNIDYGVQVTSIGSGLLSKVGISKGYIITAINGERISDIDDLNRYTDKIKMIDGIYPNGRQISYSIFND